MTELHHTRLVRTSALACSARSLSVALRRAGPPDVLNPFLTLGICSAAFRVSPRHVRDRGPAHLSAVAP